MNEAVNEDAPSTQHTYLSAAFADAVSWVSKIHADQHRKGKPHVPYVSHLLGAASLVLEAGGNETEAIAALLHDAVEDHAAGDHVALSDRIRRRFGPRVLEIVMSCTDGTGTRDASDWRVRKENYLEHLRTTSDRSAVLVSAADKLHNARSIVADLHTGRPALTLFNADPEQQRWYYGALREVLCARPDTPPFLARELDHAVDELFDRLGDLTEEMDAWNEVHPVDAPDDH